MKKRLLIVIFILLFCGQAWAVDHYVDCSVSDGGAGTSLDPYDSFDDFSESASDNIYIKGGVTCAAAKAETATAMLEIDASGVTVENWPTDPDCVISRSVNTATYGSGCAVLDGEDTLPFGLYYNPASAAATTFIRRDIVAKDFTWNGHRVEQTSTGDITVTSDRNGTVGIGPANDADATYNILWKGTGFITGRGTMNYAHYQITSTDDFALNCGRAGFDTRGKQTSTYTRVKSFYAGLTEGAMGIMTHTANTPYTSGWADQTGGIWSRAVVSANDDEQLVVDETASPKVKYYRGADDDTTPDAGEFSIVSNATIYVNFGATDPNTITSRIIRQPASTTITDCEFAETNDQDTFHGHGIGADDYTIMHISRCYVHDNEGTGIQFTSSQDGSVTKSLIINNGKKGIYGSGGDSLLISNNTVVGNAEEQISMAGEMRTGQVDNNLTQGGTYGIRYQHDALTDITDTDYSNIGYVASTNNCTGPTCTESNPLLMPGYSLHPQSPAIDAGVPVWTYAAHPADVNGNKVYGVAPDIGWKEYIEKTIVTSPITSGVTGKIVDNMKHKVHCASTDSNCYVQP